MKPERGVALIQVLFICTILALLALHFTLTGRQQVEVASLMQERTQAYLRLNDWQNELMFALLTQPTVDTPAKLVAPHALAQYWNFYGKPFSPEPGVVIKIQDLEGLIPLAPTTAPALSKLLEYLQLDMQQHNRILSFLEQQQGLTSRYYRVESGTSRAMFLQSMQELVQVEGIEPQTINRLMGLVTNFPQARFNPLHAPDEIHRALLTDEVAQELIRLRNMGALTADRYLNLVSVKDTESISFVRGERFRIEIQVQRGTAVAKRSLICYIRPDELEPLLWLE